MGLRGLILTMFSVLLEEVSCRRYSRIAERLALVGVAFLESFGYRQLTVVWRLRGTWVRPRRSEMY